MSAKDEAVIAAWEREAEKRIVVLDPVDNASHEYTVMFCHGLGGSGEEYLQRIAALRETTFTHYEDTRSSNPEHAVQTEIAHFLRHARFVLPNAKKVSVTGYRNSVKTAWYDVLADGRPRIEEPAAGMEDTMRFIHALAAREAALLSARGLSSNKRLFLAGFSQGGAVTLVCGHTCPVPLGGMACLSGYCCAQHLFDQVLVRGHLPHSSADLSWRCRRRGFTRMGGGLGKYSARAAEQNPMSCNQLTRLRDRSPMVPRHEALVVRG